VQRRKAYRLFKKLQEIWKNEAEKTKQLQQYKSGNTSNDVEPGLPKDPQESPARKHEWTTMHSFFAVMGGFAFDTSNVPKEEKFLLGSRDRVTLHPDAVESLAQEAPLLLLDISQAAIADKCKANALAKGIVCLQAVWFTIQCVFRLSQGLSISLLELNTFAHAICALVIYFL
jgi:hypothetical protein